MSLRFEFRLAGDADDTALRTVLRQGSMRGDISLAFAREPSFFTAERAGNLHAQTLVCEDRLTGDIVGMGSRGIRQVFVDGTPQTMGYLSGLRLAPAVRNGTVLVRGYRALRMLHADGKSPYYLTVILDDNAPARSLLEGGRAGMPAYIPAGIFLTYLIPLESKLVQKSRPVINLCKEDVLRACACLRRWNSRHQFAPVYEPENLAGESGLLPGLCSSNIYVCKVRGDVVGTLAVWDQQAFKQIVVTGYSKRMQLYNYAYNALASLRGRGKKPEPGGNVNLVYAALMSSTDDDRSVFESLIENARAEWSGRGHQYLLVGLSQDHKLGDVASRMAAWKLKSRIYLVHWPELRLELPTAGRIPHVELATL